MDSSKQPQPPHPDFSSLSPRPITETPHRSLLGSKKRRRMKLWHGLIIFLLLIIALSGIGLILYTQALRPVDVNDQTSKVVEINSGATPSGIAALLQESGVIRHAVVFEIYTRLNGMQNNLQAGTYQLKPSQSTQEVAAALVEGPGVQDIEVTFLPGGTVADAKLVLEQAGFKDDEVEAALKAHSDHPLFAGRPTSADLEGYLHGETHRFTSETSVHAVLEQFFDDYYKVIIDNDLEARFKKHGLTLYEGIILASIVQKEVAGEGDSRQVAQVFYKRLAKDMPLGADATFVYAAKKAGETPRVDYPSPYNTRLHSGLPPGPISTPGIEALLAVADPARGEYLYFVSGDDGKNYFSKTEKEHIENTKKYCKENCNLF